MHSLQDQSAQTQYTDEFPEVRAYVEWLRERYLPGKWASDPRQPSLLAKNYEGAARTSLDSRFPLQLGSTGQMLSASTTSSITGTPEQLLAWLLYYTHGLTRYPRPLPGNVITITHQSVQNSTNTPPLPRVLKGPASSPLLLGRPVASGGSLHPLELYLAIGTQWQISPGIYHYNSVHHALDLLREGEYISSLSACLPEKNRLSPSSAVILPAVYFQKNYRKYKAFSYQLQMLDAGIVIEQIRFVAHTLGLASTTYLEFLDGPLHHLFDLAIEEECIYAAISLQPSAQNGALAQEAEQEIDEKETGLHKQIRQNTLERIKKLPALSLARSQALPELKEDALFSQLHAATLLHALPEKPVVLMPLATYARRETPPSPSQGLSLLPSAPFDEHSDLATTLLRKRRTSFRAIDTRALPLADLSSILAYTSLTRGSIEEYQLYCVVSNVEGLAAGVYRYDPDTHTLKWIHERDLVTTLHRAAVAPNIQLVLAPVNLFFTGNYQQACQRFGSRGFRLLGLEVGRALQRASLASAARNLAIHIHLSYDLPLVEKQLLCLTDNAQLSLASLMLGLPRPAQNGLFEQMWY